MKRIAILALAASALSAGIANAQYDPYWDVNRGAAQTVQGAKEKAQGQTRSESRLKAAPLDQQTNYSPS